MGSAVHGRRPDDGPLESMAATTAYLFGRKTFEKRAFWPYQPNDNPMAAHLNATPKYVATRTLRQPTWSNSHVLTGDLGGDVAELKAHGEGNVVVLGSGELVQQLIADDLIDEYRLFLHPLVLGTGKRLFRTTDEPKRLRLLEAVPTTTGVLAPRTPPPDGVGGNYGASSQQHDGVIPADIALEGRLVPPRTGPLAVPCRARHPRLGQLEHANGLEQRLVQASMSRASHPSPIPTTGRRPPEKSTPFGGRLGDVRGRACRHGRRQPWFVPLSVGRIAVGPGRQAPGRPAPGRGSRRPQRHQEGAGDGRASADRAHGAPGRGAAAGGPGREVVSRYFRNEGTSKSSSSSRERPPSP